MNKNPQILATQTVVKTRLFHVEEVELRFSNGVECHYERLLGSPQGAVLIIPLLSRDEVLLVREYAVGVERYELTLPKGKIDTGESMLQAAARELTEEVGFAARKLHHLSSLTVAPGYLRGVTHLVVAEDLYPLRTKGDEPEQLEVVPWRLDNLVNLFARDDCTEARTVAALYLLRDWLTLRDQAQAHPFTAAPPIIPLS
ncbi:MAG: ADP compounds hydrolase NudE [Gammaproteobacteria bacterium]|nr:ADP compounds hydrolase NudE [Gammaproteobacteria bacterium]